MMQNPGFTLWRDFCGDWRVQVERADYGAALRADRRFARLSWTVGGDYMVVFGFAAGGAHEAREMVEAALGVADKMKGGRGE